MTYSINWPITVRSAVPFRSGNYNIPNITEHYVLYVQLLFTKMVAINEKTNYKITHKKAIYSNIMV